MTSSLAVLLELSVSAAAISGGSKNLVINLMVSNVSSSGCTAPFNKLIVKHQSLGLLMFFFGCVSSTAFACTSLKKVLFDDFPLPIPFLKYSNEGLYVNISLNAALFCVFSKELLSSNNPSLLCVLLKWFLLKTRETKPLSASHFEYS